MKVLITGGAGFIGSHIADALVCQGAQPVVVDDLSTGSIDNVAERVPFYHGDIRDPAFLETVFIKEQPEVVCHHAAQVDVRKSMRDPYFDAQVNILGSLNVIRLSAKHRVRKLIFASTSAVYPEAAKLPSGEDHVISPVSAYGIAKHVVENYLRLYYETSGLGYTVFRYGNVYGPRQNPHGEAGVIAIFTQQLLSGVQPTIFGDGLKTRDYVAVEDVVRANLMVMNGKGHGVFNIGSGREISDFEVFDAVRNALGAKIEPAYQPRRQGELTRVCLDTTKAHRKLDWSPQIGFAQGISKTVNYYVNRCAPDANRLNASNLCSSSIRVSAS